MKLKQINWYNGGGIWINGWMNEQMDGWTNEKNKGIDGWPHK